MEFKLNFYTDPRVPAAATQNEATAQRTNAKEAANFIFNLLCKPSGWHSDKGRRARNKNEDALCAFLLSRKKVFDYERAPAR
jgi:hypothetical protein